MSRSLFLAVSHVNLGSSLSGGDQIYLNLVKEWGKLFSIRCLVCPEAKDILQHQAISAPTTLTTTAATQHKINTLTLLFHHLHRTQTAIIFCLKNRHLLRQSRYLYTASDFYGDFLFGLISKLVNPKIIWICGYYLISPFPLDPRSPYRQHRQWLRGLIYYLAQQPTLYLATRLADHIFVTSATEKDYFLRHHLSAHRVHIVQGGVNLPPSQQLSQMVPFRQRQYQAIFIGRLHSQKGVLELVRIWSLVTQQLPQAQLAIVGDGELKQALVRKINQYQLSGNVHLLGFVAGQELDKIITQSQVVVHPAIYDSGGMAAASALAWGLPGVSFDLPSLKKYYPQGVVKTACFDLEEFAHHLVRLLTHRRFYQTKSRQARQLIVRHWSWQQRFHQLYTETFARK